jgi:hypothetical protein
MWRSSEGRRRVRKLDVRLLERRGGLWNLAKDFEAIGQIQVVRGCVLRHGFRCNVGGCRCAEFRRSRFRAVLLLQRVLDFALQVILFEVAEVLDLDALALERDVLDGFRFVHPYRRLRLVACRRIAIARFAALRQVRGRRVAHATCAIARGGGRAKPALPVAHVDENLLDIVGREMEFRSTAALASGQQADSRCTYQATRARRAWWNRLTQRRGRAVDLQRVAESRQGVERAAAAAAIRSASSGLDVVMSISSAPGRACPTMPSSPR